jgi:hypothetical protein
MMSRGAKPKWVLPTIKCALMVYKERKRPLTREDIKDCLRENYGLKSNDVMDNNIDLATKLGYLEVHKSERSKRVLYVPTILGLFLIKVAEIDDRVRKDPSLLEEYFLKEIRVYLGCVKTLLDQAKEVLVNSDDIDSQETKGTYDVLNMLLELFKPEVLKLPIDPNYYDEHEKAIVDLLQRARYEIKKQIIRAVNYQLFPPKLREEALRYLVLKLQLQRS